MRSPNPFVHLNFIRAYYTDAYDDLESLTKLLKGRAYFNALMSQPASLQEIRAALDHGDDEKLDELFSFDTKRYAAAQTDVLAAASVHPIEHLFRHGLVENRLRNVGVLHNLWGPVDSFATDFDFVSAQTAPLRNPALLRTVAAQEEASPPLLDEEPVTLGAEDAEDISVSDVAVEAEEAAASMPVPASTPLPALEDLSHVMIGQPGRAIVPFTAHLRGPGWQKPKDIGRASLEAHRSELVGCDVSILARDPGLVEWVGGVGRAQWIVDQAPIDYPLMLTTASIFAPAWHRLRVRLEGKSVVYAPEDEIAEWSAQTREDYRAFGQDLRPRLSRLQTARRLARMNKVDMGRRYGPLGTQRILILGSDAEKPDALQSNPEMVKDIDVISLALLERPNANVLYLAGKKAQDNKVAIKAIRDLSDRVRVIDQAIGISEFAHIVSEVRTVDSRLGLMALAVGLPLVVHGRPAYAGLGVTRDIDSSGAPVPMRLREPLDADTFLGWQFRDCMLFADPLDGKPLDVRSFIDSWTPFLGELSDEIADRIVALACETSQTPDEQCQYIRALAAHAKNDHLATLFGRIGNAEAVKTHLALAREIALDAARRGDWREAVHRVRLMWGVHAKAHQQELFDLLVAIRRTLSSSEESKTFAPYLITLFRHLTSSMIKSLGDTFAKSSFFAAALTMYASCQPSKEVAIARAQCLTSIGDVDAAAKIIAELQRMAVPTDELDLALDQRRGNTAGALSRLAAMVEKSPADMDLQMRLATAYREAGRLEEAADIFMLLMRTKFSVASCRALGQINVTRMQTSAAEGYISAFLVNYPSDPGALRTLADVHLFNNDLQLAGDTLLDLLKLNPLNIGAHTQLTELEAEMKLIEPDGFGPWTRAFDAFLAEIDQHSVETLMAQGRCRLQQHDLLSLRDNCQQIMTLFPSDVTAHVWYAHALAWARGAKPPEVLAAINTHYDIAIAREREDNSWLLLDSIRTAAYFGDIAAIRRLTRENHFGLYVGDREKLVIPRYSAAAALGDFAGMFDATRALLRTRIMRRNAHHFRLALSLEDVELRSTILLVSEGGVGDELRCSLIYPELAERLGSFAVTVDERLLTLFERSFPMIERFVPLPRYHNKRLNRDLVDHIGQLPDRELGLFFNNDAWRMAQECDVVVPVACLLADLRKEEDDFARAKDVRLKPRPDLVEAWRHRLAEYDDRLIVGVTWTSMLRQYQRIGNYLSHEEMEPLFRTPGAVFVNCQYEPIDEELRWARESLGVEIIDFPDLDKRDDFENLAALIANLDLFIGTGTTTTEFAGLVGCDTIYASFSMMNAYRNPAGTEHDRFIDSMRIISSVSCGREAAIARIKALLDQAIDGKMRRRTSRATEQWSAA